ncbi:MAG: hypothetical protein Q9191_008207, partial [Dirinaria sp. TL-2023a]
MKWYNEISYLLLKGKSDEDASFIEIHDQLEKRIVCLYQELLIYLMKSVCSCYRNRFHVILRDTLRLDDWDGSLKSVEVAEKTLQNDNSMYKVEKNTANLETLTDIAKSSEDREYLRYLRLTDPRHDKKRIEQTK